MSISIDWLKAIQLQPRFLFGLWLLGSLIMFLPASFAQTLGITEVRISFRPWIGLGTLTAFAFWLVQLIPEFRRYQQGKDYRRQVIDALESISPEEWILLGYCLQENQQTITLSLIDRTAVSLVARGILVQASGVGNNTAWPYTIPDFLWKHLREKRDDFFKRAPFPHDVVVSHFQGLHDHIHRYDR